jgi:glutamate 5-kinase
VKRIVVKVGTSTLMGGRDTPDRVFINALAAQIAQQRQAAGRQVVLVTSGAIRAGMDRMGRRERPRTIPEKQAAASVGQGVLMALYADIFANYAIPVGQVLLTRDDLRHRTRYVNARNTFEALLDTGALPIVNENDTVATEEIRVGDNDTLAALVTSLIGADALLLLSDVDGLYDKNPALHPHDARRVERVERLDRATMALAGEAGSPSGTGGMRTKLQAARIATGAGAHLWIADGRRAHVIGDCLSAPLGSVGTYFAPAAVRPSARKRWIAWGSGEPRGHVVVNACARRALEDEGRSLLPVGVVGVRGDFQAGEMVAVEDEAGDVFALGLARHGAAEVAGIAGRSTRDIAARPREVIHRDQLVLCPLPLASD